MTRKGKIAEALKQNDFYRLAKLTWENDNEKSR